MAYVNGEGIDAGLEEFMAGRGGYGAFEPGMLERGLAALGGGEQRDALTSGQDAYYSALKEQEQGDAFNPLSDIQRNFLDNFNNRNNPGNSDLGMDEASGTDYSVKKPVTGIQVTPLPPPNPSDSSGAFTATDTPFTPEPPTRKPVPPTISNTNVAPPPQNNTSAIQPNENASGLETVANFLGRANDGAWDGVVGGFGNLRQLLNQLIYREEGAEKRNKEIAAGVEKQQNLSDGNYGTQFYDYLSGLNNPTKEVAPAAPPAPVAIPPEVDPASGLPKSNLGETSYMGGRGEIPDGGVDPGSEAAADMLRNNSKFDPVGPDYKPTASQAEDDWLERMITQGRILPPNRAESQTAYRNNQGLDN
jgi:hypothetical protein